MIPISGSPDCMTSTTGRSCYTHCSTPIRNGLRTWRARRSSSPGGASRTSRSRPCRGCSASRNLLRQQFGHARRQRRLTDQISALTTEADALGSLRGPDVEALTLVTWHGLDTAEAAAVVGISPHAFTARLHRARKRLADALRRTDQSRTAAVRLSRPPLTTPGGSA